MPTCVGDAYVARLVMIEAERAKVAAQIVMLPRLKNADRQRVVDRWDDIIAESRRRIGNTVVAQVRDVRRWLKAHLGSGISE